MKKRLLSWLLVLTMVISLIPSTLVTTAFAADNTSAQASGQAGKTKVELTNTWPSDLSADITDVTITDTIAPGSTLTVGSGKTLILHGSGFISGGTANQTMVIVEEGGHLVLDEVTIQNNTVGSDGAIYVKSGGLLDLGYYDQRARTAPSITANTAKNLVVEEKATVRLNAEATKPIGISYAGDINETSPKSLMVGGRYAIQNSDMASNKISLDNATGLELVLKNDNIVVHPQKAKVLYWYPTNTMAWALSSSERTEMNQAYVPGVQNRFQDAGAETTNLIGSQTNRKSFIGSNVGDLEKNDFIYITPGAPSGSQTVGAYTEEEAQALLKYLDKGGRIFIQAENGDFAKLNSQATALAQKLNAGFSFGRGVQEIAPAENNPASPLTKGVSASWNVVYCSEILADKTEGVTPVFWVHGTTVGKVPFCMDITAGSAVDSTPWGNVTVLSDGGLWTNAGGFSSKSFAAAMITNTVENRIIAATGVNPNLTVESQATIDGTDYPTVKAALAKVTETNTVTMLTNSNAALTPTRDELLFEQSTLAYEAGSQYDGSTIHADTAGVYLDINKTGEVNLRSGTVTVTPNSETYPLVLNGTMDDTGSTITGGYKITSATKYQLIADDPTSPFLAQNGGKASIVIPNAGESVTVDYGGGKTVTYTAKTANEKVYLGWYQVTKQTPANMTWTDDGKAWPGQTFTTTLEPNAGYEINGENLTIADTDNAMTGGYTLKKQGEATVDPNDNTISWTTYSTDDGKVTVKQQHLHSGSSNYNGIAILTVKDVHADISIGADDNTVYAKAPTIYVVGISKRTGHEDVQLWEYTTVRNTKDGILDKPVSGWPWEKWKVSSAASGNGTESDYKQNKVTLTSDASKLDTSSDTAQYTINLETGDKVVAFYYDWNMVNVTIKATDANGNPIPDYTDQVVEYEIGKQTTITAPNLIGYQPVTGQNTQDFTPSETNKEITFQYEKTTGNLIYKAVYVDGAGVTHDLGTFSGGTLVKGQAPNKSAQAAPTFYNYELVDAAADGIATSDGDATKFDGTNDITVTYQYQPKTKDIAVYAYVDDENGQVLNLDKTSYKGITTGQTITITAPEIAGYKVKGDTSKTFFITNNKTENQDVKFFYEKDNANDAYVLVKLVDSSNGDKVISSYQVPGVKDKAQLIKAPAAPYGYKNDPNYNNEDQTVTPTGANAPFTAEVVFKYVPNVHTVNVVLKDKLNNTNLTVNNFKNTYQVVDRESLKITAPSIYGYTMAASAEAVKELTNITEDKTVTFEYEPIDKQMVTIHVKGVGPDGKTLFESRETVTHGTASKEVTVFTLPGLKLASAMVGTEDKIADVANGKLNVSLTGVAKGGTVDVVLNYESNMANVTVKAMYNGQPLQSYTTSLEKGVQATINAPSVPGYTAKEQNKQLTPNGDTEVEFIYTKDNGNITIIVTADGTELYRKDGGTVANGSKITLTGNAAAPTIEYYTTPTAPKSVIVNGTTEVKDTLTTYEYDGVGDIIVTYEYTRKTQDVTIIKKDVDTGAKIDEQPLTGLEVGKSRTFTDGSITVPSNYQAVADRNPTSYFVEDKAGQTVTFWYKNTSADQYAQVKVDLICDGKVFQSYPVTAIKGVPTTIQAPAWTGYELKAGTKASETVTPDGTAANDKVEFEYTIKDPKTVTVVLKDNSNTANPDAEMTAPTGYTKTYTLKEGDTLEIWAPAMEGYSLAGATLNGAEASNKQLVSVSYNTLPSNASTVIFRYLPVTQANFVTHTVKFMLDTQELYSYDKKVDKGTGNVVSYPADAVKNMIPGYTYSETTYEINGQSVNASDVKDNANAVIIYHFTENTAQITISFKDKNGDPLTKDGVAVADQVLSGYRKGQKIEVSAPVLDGFTLETGEKLIQNVELSSTESNNKISFKYKPLGNSYFFLKEKLTDGTTKIIAVVNAEENQTYAPNTNGNPLDLSAYGYQFTTDADKVGDDVSPEFKADGAGFVTTSSPLGNNVYTLYYVKVTRAVEFVPVNKDALDAENLTLEEALKKTDFDTKYVIKSVTPIKPTDARVGETYKAVAQSFNGWALQDDFSKLYTVENTTDPLKVYFLYAAKSTGDVTVHYYFGDKTNPGKLLNEYTIKAVVGEKVSISAPSYLMDNKYHLRDGQTNPYVLEVTNNTKKVDFYYEANFVVVTAKTVVDGGTATTHETYEVIKDLNTNSGSTTLYPPEKAGYTLIGITADGATLTNGGADKLPTEYTNNQLALANLTQDATVTYYYKTTKASEYQTELTVEYKYNGYDLAEAKTINANTGEANSIDIPAFDGYKASTYDFKDGSKAPVTGAGISGTTVSVTPAEKTATLTITYTRPDGSIVLPGKGDKIGDSDDIIVKPTDPNTPPTLNPDNGSVTIPKDPAGNTGTVTRPKDPTRPADGKEDIIVPGGTTIDKDGTIHLPDGGGTINPGDKLPGATPADYISVVYKANGGTGDDVIDLIKNDQTTINARTNPFTNGSQTFTGWNTADNGVGGTAYGENAPITIPNDSNTITLYAQWGKAEYKHTAKITYQANDGVTNAIEDTVGANDSTKFSINLRSNPFSVSGWDFGGWNTEANGTGTLKAANAVVEVTANNDQTWYAQWYKVGANGSITVPGDGNPNTTDDNVTANGTGVTRDPDTGNISIPAGGNVVKGNETIALPNGGTLKPDGSLSINKPNGGDQIEVKPDGSTDNADVVVLTYEANNGTNDTSKVYATKGEAIAPLAADTFSYSGHAFLYWKSGDTIFKTDGTITPTDAMTLSAVWAKVNNNGSIELPGTDGKLEAPDNKDNVIVTPDQPDGKVTPRPDGSVKVEENGGTVTRPTDPDHPENGKEEIKVPEGTVVEPDGTIKLPDGTVIDPDKRIPDDVTPTNYFVVTYEPGDGSGDVIRDVITKNADTTLRDEDTFTAPNGKIFDGWLDGAQTKHDAGDTLTVSESMTFTAQWKDGTPTPPAPKYSATIVFDPNTGDATATQTVTSADSATITRNFDAYTQHFTAPAGWTFMGWSTTKAASRSSSFYADGAEETLKDGVTLNLYAILYKLDADTKVITLPGKGGQPEGGDDVTVTPGAGADLTVDKGFIKAPAGSEIKQPANATPIKVIEGEVNVYPDGTVYVPEGSKVQLPDGSEIKGETTVDPDGTPDVDNAKPVQKPDGTIVLPGQNGVIGTGDDDITIAPAGPNQPAGRIDEDGNVTITNPSGADVNIPGSNPADFKVPNGTVIKPNGDMTLLYTIRYVDGSGTEIKTATVKPVQRGISETVEAATITGYTVNGEATKTASGEVSANLADYTITFNYTKNSSGGGSSSGGGGGGGSSSGSATYPPTVTDPEHGSVTVTPQRPGKGETVVIRPTPDEGYEVDDVVVTKPDGSKVPVKDNGNGTWTFEQPSGKVTVKVTFKPVTAAGGSTYDKCPGGSSCPLSAFTDTSTTAWYHDGVHYCIDNGLMNGKSATVFDPNGTTTRGQIVTILWRLEGSPKVDAAGFTDVASGLYYTDAVAWAAANGIVTGYADGSFKSNAPITREQMATILYRYCKYKGLTVSAAADLSGFADRNRIAPYAEEALAWANAVGLVNGKSASALDPTGSATRAQVATILMRFSVNIVNK